MNAVTGRLLPVYGSLYLEQYRGRPERARLAVEICRAMSDGVMNFDTCYVEAFGWWGLLKGGFPEGSPGRTAGLS